MRKKKATAKRRMPRSYLPTYHARNTYERANLQQWIRLPPTMSYSFWLCFSLDLAQILSRLILPVISDWNGVSKLNPQAPPDYILIPLRAYQSSLGRTGGAADGRSSSQSLRYRLHRSSSTHSSP